MQKTISDFRSNLGPEPGNKCVKHDIVAQPRNHAIEDISVFSNSNIFHLQVASELEYMHGAYGLSSFENDR